MAHLSLNHHYILTPDFDPSKIKVAQLRSILRENDIEFPATAKKKELVGIFNSTLALQNGKSPKSPNVLSPIPDSEIEVIEVDTDQQNSPEEKPKKKKSEKKKSEKVRKPSKKKEPKSPESDKLKVESSDAEKTDEKAVEESKDSIVDSLAHDSTIQETPKSSATKSPFVTSSSSKKLKKRKSSVFDDHSELNTPPKGNIFEVDVDSDSDTVIFSPKPKKAKTLSLPAPEKKPKARKVSAKRESSRGSISPAAEIARSAYEDVKHNLSKSTPTKEEKPPSPKVKKQSPPVKQEVSAPVLAPIPDSTTDVSRDDTTGSVDDKWGSSIKEDFVDDANNFDAALSKLKGQEDNSLTTKGRKDEELAKLLGVDVHGVKPKPRGRRSITPRRPIVIPERRLASNNGSLLEDLEKDVLPIEPLSTKKDEWPSSVSDEEADTDIEDQEEQEEEAPKRTLASRAKGKKPRPQKVATTLLFIGLWVVLIGLAMFGYWYREQTILIGYCGNEIDKPTIPTLPDTPVLLSKLGDYLDDNFKPTCVPCPQHARCFPNLKLACYEDFVEYKPWYYQYWPVFDPRAKKCIPDTKKAEKVELMINEALDLLRARNANIQCGLTGVDNFEAGIEVNELHDLLLALKAPYITEEEFEDLWKRSVVELEKEPEITVRQVANFSTDPEWSRTVLLKLY